MRHYLRKFILTAMLCLAALPALAGAPTLKDMITIHDDLDNPCRGTVSDEKQTLAACATREKVSKLIKGNPFIPFNAGQDIRALPWRTSLSSRVCT